MTKEESRPQEPPKPIDYEPPNPSLKNRKIVYETGKFEVFVNGKGFTKLKIRATFADDPEGCRGYGNTQEEAKERLFYYENY